MDVDDEDFLMYHHHHHSYEDWIPIVLDSPFDVDKYSTILTTKLSDTSSSSPSSSSSSSSSSSQLFANGGDNGGTDTSGAGCYHQQRTTPDVVERRSSAFGHGNDPSRGGANNNNSDPAPRHSYCGNNDLLRTGNNARLHSHPAVVPSSSPPSSPLRSILRPHGPHPLHRPHQPHPLPAFPALSASINNSTTAPCPPARSTIPNINSNINSCNNPLWKALDPTTTWTWMDVVWNNNNYCPKATTTTTTNTTTTMMSAHNPTCTGNVTNAAACLARRGEVVVPSPSSMSTDATSEDDDDEDDDDDDDDDDDEDGLQLLNRTLPAATTTTIAGPHNHKHVEAILSNVASTLSGSEGDFSSDGDDGDDGDDDCDDDGLFVFSTTTAADTPAGGTQTHWQQQQTQQQQQQQQPTHTGTSQSCYTSTASEPAPVHVVSVSESASVSVHLTAEDEDEEASSIKFDESSISPPSSSQDQKTTPSLLRRLRNRSTNARKASRDDTGYAGGRTWAFRLFSRKDREYRNNRDDDSDDSDDGDEEEEEESSMQDTNMNDSNGPEQTIAHQQRQHTPKTHICYKESEDVPCWNDPASTTQAAGSTNQHCYQRLSSRRSGRMYRSSHNCSDIESSIGRRERDDKEPQLRPGRSRSTSRHSSRSRSRSSSTSRSNSHDRSTQVDDRSRRRLSDFERSRNTMERIHKVLSDDDNDDDDTLDVDNDAGRCGRRGSSSSRNDDHLRRSRSRDRRPRSQSRGQSSGNDRCGRSSPSTERRSRSRATSWRWRANRTAPSREEVENSGSDSEGRCPVAEERCRRRSLEQEQLKRKNICSRSRSRQSESCSRTSRKRNTCTTRMNGPVASKRARVAKDNIYGGAMDEYRSGGEELIQDSGPKRRGTVVKVVAIESVKKPNLFVRSWSLVTSESRPPGEKIVKDRKSQQQRRGRIIPTGRTIKKTTTAATLPGSRNVIWTNRAGATTSYQNSKRKCHIAESIQEEHMDYDEAIAANKEIVGNNDSATIAVIQVRGELSIVPESRPNTTSDEREFEQGSSRALNHCSEDFNADYLSPLEEGVEMVPVENQDTISIALFSVDGEKCLSEQHLAQVDGTHKDRTFERSGNMLEQTTTNRTCRTQRSSHRCIPVTDNTNSKSNRIGLQKNRKLLSFSSIAQSLRPPNQHHEANCAKNSRHKFSALLLKRRNPGVVDSTGLPLMAVAGPLEGCSAQIIATKRNDGKVAASAQQITENTPDSIAEVIDAITKFKLHAERLGLSENIIIDAISSPNPKHVLQTISEYRMVHQRRDGNNCHKGRDINCDYPSQSTISTLTFRA